MYIASDFSNETRNLPDFKLNYYLIIKFLLEKGANPNVRYRLTNPILFYAIGANNLEAVKCLVEHGADLKQQEAYFYGYGKIPSEWAAGFKFKEIETYLKQKEKEMDSK